MKLLFKALTMVHAKGIAQFYLPPARLSTNGMNHPAFTPAAERHHTLVGTYFPSHRR